jgi:probable phosphoglycerate mutase
LKEIILIQHCQSEHHVNNLTGGWTDTPLTEWGRKQAQSIATRLKKRSDLADHMLYSSDLKRASQTAAIIGDALAKNVIEDTGLREINNGIAAGKTKAWAKENGKPLPDTGFYIDYLQFPGGETWREFYHRISNCMQKLTESAEKLIIVTHGCALGYIVPWWLHFEARMLENAVFRASPGSISVLEWGRFQQNTLKVFNDRAHLPEH